MERIVKYKKYYTENRCWYIFGVHGTLKYIKFIIILSSCKLNLFSIQLKQLKVIYFIKKIVYRNGINSLNRL